AVEPPFARGTVAAEPTSFEVHEWNIIGLQHLVVDAARTYQETTFVVTHADIARFAMRQPQTGELATGRQHHRAQRSQARARTRGAHSAARRSGYNRCNPARLAGQLPRSVISPVTSRAGVTSKARFSAALVSGTSLTDSMRPEELLPL